MLFLVLKKKIKRREDSDYGGEKARFIFANEG